VAKTLIVLNDAPYGTERSYNGLRYAIALLKASEEVHLFLIGDAAACAVRRTSKVGACGTCMDARGITDAELVEGTHRSTMAELVEWHQSADKAIAF
jgi:uncharacterized protein involved in oxidation of intracellular sulfur